VNAQSNEGETPLHHAVRARNRRAIELLVSRRAVLDLPNQDGDTPLLLALKLGYDEIAAMLIKNGADTNVRNKQGLSALHYAVTPSDNGPRPVPKHAAPDELPPLPRIQIVP
jgi:ankyrin repeat protein